MRHLSYSGNYRRTVSKTVCTGETVMCVIGVKAAATGHGCWSPWRRRWWWRGSRETLRLSEWLRLLPTACQRLLHSTLLARLLHAVALPFYSATVQAASIKSNRDLCMVDSVHLFTMDHMALALTDKHVDLAMSTSAVETAVKQSIENAGMVVYCIENWGPNTVGL